MSRALPGVHATPPPVAGWIVRSVHHLLRSRFDRPEGLADPGIRLLDPAAGPLNFILAAWREALREHRRTGGEAGDLLRGHLLLHSRGLEIHGPSCSRGRRALSRFLAARGLEAGTSRDLVLRHRDALAEPAGLDVLTGGLPVILGNPPWIGSPAPASPWMAEILRDYRFCAGRPLAERNLKWLQDTWVRFLRLAQWAVERHGEGVVAFVLNHNGLDAPTFRGLRFSILRTFEEIFVLDLHGSRRKRERSPDGSLDENLFPGVGQGSALLLLVKRPGLSRRLHHADLYGTRQRKLAFFRSGSLADTGWQEIRPRSPLFLFRPGADLATERDFLRGTPLPEIFPVYGPGIITGCDSLVTDADRRALEDRLRRTGRGHCLPHLTAYQARPFDLRYLIFTADAVARPRLALVRHLRSVPNLALLVPRQHKEEAGAFVTAALPGHKAVSAYDVTSAFPLYLDDAGRRRPNLAPRLVRRLAEWYGVSPAPDDVMAYVYAVLYAPHYRSRFRELLARQFPRISFPHGLRSFTRLAGLGRELLALHLLVDPRLCEAYSRELPPRGSDGVTPDLWAYRIGGYRVLEQWLAARSKRPRRPEESRELAAIAEALRLTLVLQGAVDEVFLEIAAEAPVRRT